MDQCETQQDFDLNSQSYLQGELEAKKILLDTVHLEKETLKTKCSQLELLLEKKEQKISQYAEKLSEYQAALHSRDDVVSLLQQNLTSSLTQLEQQRAGTGNTALQLQEEVDGLSQQLQQALQLLSERDDRGNSWRVQHFQLQQQVEKLTRENEEVCSKLLHAEKTLLSLRDERKKDENKYSEARKQLQTVTYEWSVKEKIFSEKSKKLEAVIVDLEQNLQIERQARWEASEQLDEMRREGEEVAALRNKCVELGEFLANSEAKNLVYNNQLTELRSSLTLTTNELERSQSRESDFTLKTDAYVNQIETLETSIVNLNENIVEKDKVQLELLSEIKSNDEEFTALKKQILEFTDEIQENEGKYEELIKKCKGLEKELLDCQSNILDLNNVLASKDIEKQTMSSELGDLKIEKDNLSSQLLSLEHNMKSVHEQLSNLEVQRNYLREQEQQLLEDIKRLVGEVAASEKAKEELDSCLRERDGLIVTLEGEKEELNRLVQEQVGQMASVKNEKEDLNRRLHEQTTKMVSIVQEKEELKCRIEKLEFLEQASEKIRGISVEVCHDADEGQLEQRPAARGQSRDKARWRPLTEQYADLSCPEEMLNQIKQLTTKISNLNFVIKSLENENSNLKRHKKENKVLNETVNETLQRNAELLAELENMTLKYKEAEIRLKALDSEVELFNNCVKELQQLRSSCDPDTNCSVGDSSDGECWRLSQELALNMSQQRLQEHEQTMLLIKNNHEQSRTAQLTLRDELREAVYTNMALHAHSLAASETCHRLADANVRFRDLLTRALDWDVEGLWYPSEENQCTGATSVGGATVQPLFNRWRVAVVAALDQMRIATKELHPSSESNTSDADAIVVGQHRIERLLEETATDGVEACALQGVQWAYHLLLCTALSRCCVQWPLDVSLQSVVSLQWGVRPASSSSPHHEQDCLRYAGLCRALCSGTMESGEEEGRRTLQGQLRDLQRDVEGSVERGVASVLDTVRGLLQTSSSLQVEDGPVIAEVASSPRSNGAAQGGEFMRASDALLVAPTSQQPLPPPVLQTEEDEHDPVSQTNTLTQPDHLQNLLGDREVHQTVIVQLTEACGQLLHYYCVSEACNRSHRAADAAAASPDTSHDTSNIDGFIDDTLWSSGSHQPRSLDAAADAKLSSIIALVEKYEQERPLEASDHSGGRTRLWDTGLSHGSLQDDIEEMRVRNRLLASYPNLMTCLSGQWENVDLQGLDKDVQEMTISLQASAGMLKVMLQSKQHENIQHCASPLKRDDVEGTRDIEEHLRNVAPEASGDGGVSGARKDSVSRGARSPEARPLLSELGDGAFPLNTDTMIGANTTEAVNSKRSALSINTMERTRSDLQDRIEMIEKTGSVPSFDSMLCEAKDGSCNSAAPDSPNCSSSSSQTTASNHQGAHDADMTRLKPSKAAVDHQTEEDKLLKLTAEVQQVKSENHRLHGLCLGLQTEKKKLQEELESLEKYSSFITRELQTVQQSDGSEAPRSTDSEEYSSSGTEQGATSPLAQHARSLLLQRGQSSSAARVGELEAVLEALLREQHEQRKALTAQTQDLTTQLECADRQLRASRQFVEELTHEREAEVEQFVQSNARLTEQLREHAAAAEHTARLSAEVEALEGELGRQTRDVEALTGEAAQAKEALKEAHAKIQELCAVLSNREDAEAVSAARQSEAQAQLTALREQLTHAHQQLDQHQELQTTAADDGPASSRRSPCPHCSGSIKRPAVDSPRLAAPRRHSLREEMLQEDTPSKAGPLDATLAEDMNKSTICKVEQRVVRLTKNLEAMQFAGQQDSINQRTGDVDDAVSSDEEEWGGYGSRGDESSLRSLSPSAMDRRLEDRLMAMERVTQAAVKHTADLEMTLALTRTNLQEALEEKEKVQQNLDEVTQQLDVVQQKCSSHLALIEQLQKHNKNLQNQCQSQQENARSLELEVESRSNDCMKLSKERETLLQRLSGFEEEVSKLLNRVHNLELAGVEAVRNEEANGRLAEEAEQNTKIKMRSILHQLDEKTRYLESSNKQLDEKSKKLESISVELENSLQQLEDARRELKATRDHLEESKQEVVQRTRELEEVQGEREYLQKSLSEQLVKVAGLQARLEEQKRVGQSGASMAEMEARLLAQRAALDRATNDITLKDRQLADLKYNFSEQRTLLLQREEELERLQQRPVSASPSRSHAATQTLPTTKDSALAMQQPQEANMRLEAATRQLHDDTEEEEESNASDPEVLRRASVASSVMLHPHWSAAVCSSNTSALSNASSPRPHSPRLALDSPQQICEQSQQQLDDEPLQQVEARRHCERKIAQQQEHEQQQELEYERLQTSYERLQTSYEQLKNELKTAVEQHEMSVRELQTRCTESESSLSELRELNSKMQNSLKISKQSEKILHTSNNKLQKELANGSERLDAVSKELDVVAQRLSDLQQQNENNRKVIDEQNKHLAETNSELTDMDARLQTVSKQLQQELNRGQLLQQERSKMQQDLSNAQLQLEQSEAQLLAEAGVQQDTSRQREQKGTSQPASAEAREVSALQERVDRRAASLQLLERRLGTADASVSKLEQQLQNKQTAVEQLTAQLAASDEHIRQLKETVQVLRTELEQRAHSPRSQSQDLLAHINGSRRNFSASPSSLPEDITTGLGQSQLSGCDSTLDVTNLTPEEASRMAARLGDRVQRDGAQVLELTEFLFLKGAAVSCIQDSGPQAKLGPVGSLQQHTRVTALERCVKQQRELNQCRQDGQEVQALENRLQHERLTRLRLEGQLTAATSRNDRLELQLRDLAATLDQLRCTQEETECQLERGKYELSEERSNFLQVSDNLRRATKHSSAQHRRHHDATKELERCLQEERLTKSALLEEISQLRTQLATSRPPAADRLPAPLSDVMLSHSDCEELQRLACQNSAATTERRLWRTAEASLVSQHDADDKRQALLLHKQLRETIARLSQEKELVLLQKGRAEQRCGELEQQYEELQHQCGRLEQTLRRQMALQAEAAGQSARVSPPPTTAQSIETVKEEKRVLQQRNADLHNDRTFYQQQCSRLQQELSQRPGWPITAPLLPVAETEELKQRLQHTFARYLRAQSHKKSLVWQKKYLLGALSQHSNASPRLRALLHPTMIAGPTPRLVPVPPLVRFR